MKEAVSAKRDGVSNAMNGFVVSKEDEDHDDDRKMMVGRCEIVVNEWV